MAVIISLPEDVKYILDIIIKAGYEAFAVGGCIRDHLLSREPNDYDITTSARPEEIKKLFRRTVDTGIKHGTVTVLLKDKSYEVTTYRIDGKYEDNRHPSSVSFTDSLKEDLLRRDFTINAMAYNDIQGLMDPFGGQQDLKDKRIRCVGVPRERFSEDALRIMRAVRFSAQLGYEIEEETLRAMKELAPNLKDVSAERIQVELVKLVTSDHPEKLVVAYEQGLTAVFLPEFDRIMETSQNHPHHAYSVGIHTIKAMQNVRNDKDLRLAMLFHDMGKPLARTVGEDGYDHFRGHPEFSEKVALEVLRRLKFDNDTIKTVSRLAAMHDYKMEISKKAVRHAMNKMGEGMLPLILEIKHADTLAQSEYKREEKLEWIENIGKLYREIVDENEGIYIKDLVISGKDLLELGYPGNQRLGEELNRLLDMVLEDPSLNNREFLLKSAKEDLL